MPELVNRRLLLQDTWDSGQLTVLAAVCHPFGVLGEYRGAVMGQRGQLGEFRLSVGEFPFTSQVHIDLQSCVRRPSAGSTHQFRVNLGGHGVFFVGKGEGGFCTVLRNAADEVVFDSRKLTQGDLFAVYALRPGNYTATNNVTGDSVPVVVTDPDDSENDIPGPETISCGSKFDVRRIEVESGQCQLYKIESEARLVIKPLESNASEAAQSRR